MIISHKHQFVFLHGRKTAGTSIGISLMRHLACGDVVRGYITSGLATGVVPPDFDAAWRKIGVMGAARVARAGAGKWVRGTEHDKFASARQAFRVLAYREYVRRVHGVVATHQTCAEVRDLLGPERWGRYYTFTFERNPFDRMVSFYYWRTRHLDRAPSFREFVDAIYHNDAERMHAFNAHGFSNRPYYMIGGRMAVDFVGRFENLQTDLQSVFGEIGLEFDGWLPRAKTGIRRSSSRELYARYPEAISMVGSLARVEIELFGYSPA